MSNSLRSLEVTAPSMHPCRVTVELGSTKEWYKIIHEANALYGAHNWRCQPRVRRKLENNWARSVIKVWFEVPDPAFATWISVKHSVVAHLVVAK